ITAAGKHVIIIGGGDTGADCLGTAHRQGAASITQLEILPQPPNSRAEITPWPTWPLMLRTSSAHEEGGERKFAVNTEEFLSDDAGNVRALRVVEVKMSGGAIEAIAGTEFELPAELVLLAMGFVGPERTLAEQFKLDLDTRGNIARDSSYASNMPGIFVAGDAGRGQSLIVWAIAEGRAAAASVDRFLTGVDRLPAPIPPTARPLT
ncbi:MAG TPA: FAD-dependent oxidoreductase, partial [Acidothermaceae bacterium]